MPALSTPSSSAHDSTRPLRLGIAGLGTVGLGIIRLVETHKTLLIARTNRLVEIVAVHARNRHKARDIDISAYHWHEDVSSLVSDPHVDLVIEVIGGAEGAARLLIETALKAGKPVVTANKALIAHHAASLMTLSQQTQTPLLFEAAVAGAIPAIKMVREAVAADRLFYVGGILNGTCNYILSEMAKTGRDFDLVLKEAQEKGYAEAEPSTDIDGWDTAHKLTILAAIAYRPILFSSLKVEGIGKITAADLRFCDELGYVIKLLGLVRPDKQGLIAWVRPCLVPKTAPLATVNDAFNALSLDGEFCGPLNISGRGAGAGPTASAVIADIIDIARGHTIPLWGRYGEMEEPVACLAASGRKTAFYLRFLVDDHTGVIADIAELLRQEDVSVHLVSQHEESPQGQAQGRVYLSMVTHPVMAGKIEHLLPRLDNLACIYGETLALAIEDFSTGTLS